MKPSDRRSSEHTKRSPRTPLKLSLREMGDYKTTRLLDCCALDRIWSSTQRLEDLDWFGPENALRPVWGWCSCSIALEPGCSKFRGELTSWSSSVEPVGVQPLGSSTLSYVGGGFPFIVQGGAPYLHISIVVSWFRLGVLLRRQSSGPSRSVGRGKA